MRWYDENILTLHTARHKYLIISLLHQTYFDMFSMGLCSLLFVVFVGHTHIYKLSIIAISFAWRIFHLHIIPRKNTCNHPYYARVPPQQYAHYNKDWLQIPRRTQTSAARKYEMTGDCVRIPPLLLRVAVKLPLLLENFTTPKAQTAAAVCVSCVLWCCAKMLVLATYILCRRCAALYLLV